MGKRVIGGIGTESIGTFQIIGIQEDMSYFAGRWIMNGELLSHWTQENGDPCGMSEVLPRTTGR